MKLTGICNICGMAGQMNTCTFCGRNVCSGCFNSERGTCIQCVGSRRSEHDISFGKNYT